MRFLGQNFQLAEIYSHQDRDEQQQIFPIFFNKNRGLILGSLIENPKTTSSRAESNIDIRIFNPLHTDCTGRPRDLK
jgi:hypothetical protein